MTSCQPALTPGRPSPSPRSAGLMSSVTPGRKAGPGRPATAGVRGCGARPAAAATGQAVRNEAPRPGARGKRQQNPPGQLRAPPPGEGPQRRCPRPPSGSAPAAPHGHRTLPLPARFRRCAPRPGPAPFGQSHERARGPPGAGATRGLG